MRPIVQFITVDITGALKHVIGSLGKPLSAKTKRVLIFIGIIALVILIGAAIWYILHIPSLQITSPDNCATVGMKGQITGVAKNIPEGSKVWVVIRVGDRYYPQPEPRLDNTCRWTCKELLVNNLLNRTLFQLQNKPFSPIYGFNGAIFLYTFANYYLTSAFYNIVPKTLWTCDVQFGGVNDGGLDFEVIAVFADIEAQEKFAPKEGERELTVFPPKGAKEYYRIKVIRGTDTTPSMSTPTPMPDPTPTPAPIPTISPTPTPVAEPVITITAPVSNANVTMWEWVSGTSKNIPVGYELWVVVKVDGLHFPHKVEKTEINADGTWSHYVQIGQIEEGGKTFDLIAVLANSTAQVTVQDWLKNKDTPNNYTLPNMPTGMTPYSTVTVTRTSVTITYPVNNSLVNMHEWVSGNARNIPNGQQLWIVVHEGNLYFPMVDRVQINTDGTWRYNTTIGKQDDSGKNFEIIAVLANSLAQDTVDAWYKSEGLYGLLSLPSGMTPYSTVTVTRK